MKCRNLRHISLLMILAVLVAVICVASRDSEQDVAANLYAAGEAAGGDFGAFL